MECQVVVWNFFLKLHLPPESWEWDPTQNIITPWKINVETTKMEVWNLWKIIFLSKWVICRFHVNLPGCILVVVQTDMFVEVGTVPSKFYSSYFNENQWVWWFLSWCFFSQNHWENPSRDNSKHFQTNIPIDFGTLTGDSHPNMPNLAHLKWRVSLSQEVFFCWTHLKGKKAAARVWGFSLILEPEHWWDDVQEEKSHFCLSIFRDFCYKDRGKKAAFFSKGMSTFACNFRGFSRDLGRFLRWRASQLEVYKNVKSDEDLTLNSDLVFENGIGKNLLSKKSSRYPWFVGIFLDSFRWFKFFFVSFAQICTSDSTIEIHRKIHSLRVFFSNIKLNKYTEQTSWKLMITRHFRYLKWRYSPT